MLVSKEKYEKFVKELNKHLEDIRDNATVRLQVIENGNTGRFYVGVRILDAPIWCSQDQDEFEKIVNEVGRSKGYDCECFWNNKECMIKLSESIKTKSVEKLCKEVMKEKAPKQEGKLTVYTLKGNKYVRAKQEDFKRVGIDVAEMWKVLKTSLDKNKVKSGKKEITIHNKKVSIIYGYDLSEKMINDKLNKKKK